MYQSLSAQAQSIEHRGGNAEKLLRELMAIAKDSGDDALISNATTIFCDYCCHNRANFPRAQEVQKETLAYWQIHPCKFKHAEACVYWNMGATAMLRGEYAQAESSVKTALRLEKKRMPVLT